MNDTVNHPAHYTSGGIECIEAIKASMTPEEFRGYCKGTIIGNLRCRCDEDGLDSLEEAKDCIDWLIKSVKESL